MTLDDHCPECGSSATERTTINGEVVAYACWRRHAWGSSDAAVQGLLDVRATFDQVARSYRAAAEVN